METLTREMMLEVWSDLHKDAYGFRPRDWDRVNSLSLEAMTAEYDRMIVALEESIEEDKRQKARAVEEFEASILDTIRLGASDRATAIRWIRDGFNDETVTLDDGYFEYLLGLPYGYVEKNQA